MTQAPETYAADPGAVGALRDAMAEGGSDPREVLEAALARIESAEPAVQGWRVLDREGALAQAERLRGPGPRGPLHGIPVAVKDVIDVEGLPTRAGSRTRENAPPSGADATIVARLRAAGAVILGKAHTTEFAFFDGPPPTRNPHDLTRTPGGSSAGPAAVVAAGMVSASLGTQTAGSVSRPAAYCGIAAFKPSSLSWPSFGLTPFAPSFDTVGVFAYRVADAVALTRPLLPVFCASGASQPRKTPCIAVLEDPILGDADAGILRSLRDVADGLKAGGVRVESRASPVGFSVLGDLHLLIREYELGRVHAALLEAEDDAVSPSLKAAILRGLRTESGRYLEALAELAAAARGFWDAMAGFDALVFPAAPDIAPVGMATGDARYIVPFTALGGPIVSIPVGFERGLPVGVMLAGAPGSDAALLALAERIAPLIETPR